MFPGFSHPPSNENGLSLIAFLFLVGRTHLIHELQVGKEGDVLGPLHGAEQEPSRQLADVLDAHQVVSLHALRSVAGRGVGLGTQQQGDEPR